MKTLFSQNFPRILSRTFLILAALILLCAGSPAPEKTSNLFPSLEEAIKIALERHNNSANGKADSIHSADLAYKVLDNYYQLQYKNEQLSISKEVQEHFEKAVTKAEEKFDEGEGDIFQSDITKLKLGLMGTRNDVITLNSEILQESLSLNQLLGHKLDAKRKLPEGSSIKPVEFPHSTLVGYLASLKVKSYGNSSKDSKGSTKNAQETSLELEKSFIRVGEAKDKLKLAKDGRKISRTLLVTEVSNYDFGIGNTADLFQALIIYTRVLKGYYESVYQFNLAVADLKRLATKI